MQHGQILWLQAHMNVLAGRLRFQHLAIEPARGPIGFGAVPGDGVLQAGQARAQALHNRTVRRTHQASVWLGIAQGIFQLLKFGASSYTVSLIGILVLRELGVLLTSIMIAGRSGSAITAELGSMKMREEIDALRVMGLSPIEVLIAPRVLALVISLPILTYIADMAALFGGMLVSWAYGGISPAAFLSLLKEAIALHTFLVGMIKAPFMALVIGLIAAMDGLATQGSAESLGRQVTSSVVKSIFMVIVLDGLFAIFFAAIDY